ncbi:uncharacterized protein [Dipodomys merriami]|uniref:uncharacterized protein n=1 Tax=Dipodomys merriami TaxID=94247 RepID=UPI0038558E78
MHWVLIVRSPAAARYSQFTGHCAPRDGRSPPSPAAGEPRPEPRCPLARTNQKAGGWWRSRAVGKGKRTCQPPLPSPLPAPAPPHPASPRVLPLELSPIPVPAAHSSPGRRRSAKRTEFQILSWMSIGALEDDCDLRIRRRTRKCELQLPLKCDHIIIRSPYQLCMWWERSFTSKSWRILRKDDILCKCSSSLWLKSTPLHIFIIFSSSTHLLMDT